MSAIAALYNVPSTQDELATWASAHATHHKNILATIFRLANIQLQEFILDPFDPRDSGSWLLQHQEMHTEMDALLQISGYNLLELDFSDRRDLAGWIWLNADEHKQASDILGIG